MHNFILLWEPSDDAYSKQLEIANLFMNSLAVDENIAHEISNINYVSKDSSKSMTDVEKSLKEQTDSEIIYSALQMIKETDGIPHIIYAGDYYHRAFDNVLRSIIVDNIQKCLIKKVWLTKLRMQRLFVITKEKMIKISKPNEDSKIELDKSPKILTESDYRKIVQVQIDNRHLTSNLILNFDETKEDEYRKIIFSKPDYFQGSILDDLEIFVEKLGGESMSGTTYHIKKMDPYEVMLLEKKNQEFLQSFYINSFGHNPDVIKIEMDSSESESKYVLSRCSRQTFILNTEMNGHEYEIFSDTDSEIDFDIIITSDTDTSSNMSSYLSP